MCKAFIYNCCECRTSVPEWFYAFIRLTAVGPRLTTNEQKKAKIKKQGPIENIHTQKIHKVTKKNGMANFTDELISI